jgi:hypothetical protein
MSWSSGHSGKSNEEVAQKVDAALWHGLPPSIAESIKNVIYNLPEVPTGYQLVISTNGSLWVPPEGSPDSYTPSFNASITLKWDKIVVPVVNNSANVASANGTSSNT